jgi:hypothetical protein
MTTLLHTEKPSMLRLPNFFLASFLAAVPLACSGGGGGGGGANNNATIRAADLAGSWQVVMTRSLCSCAGPVIGEQEMVECDIAVTGNRVTVRQAGQPDTVLDIVGNRVRGSNVQVVGGTRQTSTIDFGIVGGRIQGTEMVVDRDLATNVDDCEQTYTMVGDRQPGQAPASADRFNGTWYVVGRITAVDGSACDPGILVGNVDDTEAVIVVTGSTATFTATGQTPVDFTVQNGRLRSTATEVNGTMTMTKDIDIGLVNDNQFEGTVTFTTRDGNNVVCTVAQALTADRL